MPAGSSGRRRPVGAGKAAASYQAAQTMSRDGRESVPGGPAATPSGDSPGALRRRRVRRAGGPGALRLLPAVAFMAAMLLSVKVGQLWTGLGLVVTSFHIPVLMAQENGATDEGAAETEGSAAAIRAARKAAEEAANKRLQPGSLGPKPRRPVAGHIGDDEMADPILFRRSEIRLLQELSRRRSELDAREAEVERRERLLAALEKRVEDKISAFEQIKSQIEALVEKYDQQEELELARIVKTYESMKPKYAARIFNSLPMEDLLKVVKRMKEKNVANIMAKMDAGRATEITSVLVDRTEMPDFGN